MQVEVHIRNGRTVFRFAKRHHLVQALAAHREPAHEGPRIIAQVKHNIDDSQWRTASVRAISPNSVSFVLEVPPEQKMTPDELRAKAKEAHSAE